MAVQLLFYQDVHPVTLDRHKDVSIKAGDSYKFAKHVNSVPVTAVEFSQAANEYPIVFAGTEDAVMPAVILGVQQTENLFVREDGSWEGKYIPAFVRRYPFVFSSDKTGRMFILHIDESFEGFNKEGRGERLFDAEGAQTRYLKEVLDFLQEYQARFPAHQAVLRPAENVGAPAAHAGAVQPEQRREAFALGLHDRQPREAQDDPCRADAGDVQQ